MANLGTLTIRCLYQRCTNLVVAYGPLGLGRKLSAPTSSLNLSTWQQVRGTLTGTRAVATQRMPLTAWQRFRNSPVGVSVIPSISLPFPWWMAGGSIFSNKQGGFSNYVRRDGVVIAGAIVRLYCRRSGQLIKVTQSAADGSYSFSGISPDDAAGYYILALDPTAVSPYNSVIFDRLTPE